MDTSLGSGGVERVLSLGPGVLDLFLGTGSGAGDTSLGICGIERDLPLGPGVWDLFKDLGEEQETLLQELVECFSVFELGRGILL